MLTQQDIYAAGSENRPPMLNKDNYVPWSSRLLSYAKSRPNGKLIYNSIMNGPYVRRITPEPGDPDREVLVNETFHEQTDNELFEKELKQVEADDQAIQTILLSLPEDIYAAVDSCETALEIWLRVVQNAVQNLGVQNVGNQNGLIVVQGIANSNANQIRNGNVVAARAEGTGNRNNGNQLQAEEFDLMVVAADLDEIEEVNAKCILMANLHFAKTITTLNEEIANLNNQLSKEKSNVSFLNEENKKLKSDFKIREEELLDKQIQLEKKIKELDNILVKIGQSIQTTHMLSPKPDSFYHTKQKVALGYQNPFYLKQAQQKQQSLYNGNVLLEKHDPPAVYDSEETLQLTQESRLKMKQLNKEIKPANYAKINHLSGVFVSQTAESREESYFSNTSKTANVSKSISILNEEFSDDTTPSVTRKFLNEIKRLQAQLGDQKGKCEDTSCVSNTLDPLSQKLENENMELEFQGLPKIDESHALSKPVTSNLVPTTKESKVVKNDKVIAPGMFRIDPRKTSREENFMPINKVRASNRTNLITVSQPHVITKKVVNSNSNGLSSTGVDNTAKTKRP
ncbi:hypothetical protein Tco_0304813 [Tanacetum coccineum]